MGCQSGVPRWSILGSKDDSSIIRQSVTYHLFAIKKVQERWLGCINLGTLINVFTIIVS